MKLTNEQFTEVAFIFEKENGNSHSEFEKGIIAESKLTKYKPTELENALEIFVTGTAAEVTPVGKIDDLKFNVGEVTKTLREDYEALVGRT